MDADKVIEQANRARTNERKAAQDVLDSAFDAADRAVLQRAAETAIKLASVPASDPV